MTGNGQQNGFRHPTPKLRFDDLRSPRRGNEAGPRHSDASLAAATEQGHSGRRFVVVAVIVVLMTWGGLYLAFQRWRASYRERVAYGETHVVSAIDPLKQVAPPAPTLRPGARPSRKPTPCSRRSSARTC